MAVAMAFAIEYQGEATPHAHGFISLANMYQNHTLEEIGQILETNAQGISPRPDIAPHARQTRASPQDRLVWHWFLLLKNRVKKSVGLFFLGRSGQVGSLGSGSPVAGFKSENAPGGRLCDF